MPRQNKNTHKRPYYPFNHESVLLIEDNKAILKHPCLGHLCGYMVINRDEIPQEWRGNYDADALQYLNVHGGITYCKDHPEHEVTIFGFDCAHVDDDKDPLLQDTFHVMSLTKQMEQQIKEYAKVIHIWRKADKERKISILEHIRDKAPKNLELGFGALIDMFGGSNSIKD